MDRQDGRPLWQVVQSRAPVTISGLAERYSAMVEIAPHPMGSEPADTVVASPVMEGGTGEPIGVLFTAVSPYRALDEDYRGFLELVAGHAAKALTDARAYEAERKRAQALAELTARRRSSSPTSATSCEPR